MSVSSALIDTTLADGVCLFRTGGGWALRRPDGLFVRLHGAAAGALDQATEVGNDPVLGPAFAEAGYLHEGAAASVHPNLRPHGRGVLHDMVAPLLTAASTQGGAAPPVHCLLLDAPPTAPTKDYALTAWAEGDRVFVSPFAPAGEAEPCLVTDVIARRIAASATPDLLRDRLSDPGRRPPLRLNTPAALLVAHLIARQVHDVPASRRRLYCLDTAAGQWEQHLIYPVPRLSDSDPRP